MNLKNSVKIAVIAALLAVICVSAHAAGNSSGTDLATGTGIGERGFYWWIPPTAETHFGGSESGLITDTM